MGIRFYCPNGHKLNVKSFQAGRRGICPHCDGRFRIPQESQIPANAPKLRAGLAVEQAGHNQPRESYAFAESVPAGVSLSDRETLPVAEAAPLDRAADGPLADGPLTNGPLANGQIPFTPVGETTDAVWFVRPPTGGQFGPAHSSVFREWVEEGRVSADSLVWCEGWPDWRVAVSVFPELEPAHQAIGAGGNTTPVSEESGGRNPGSSRVHHRSSYRARSVALVVFLGLASFGLLVTLVVILQSR